MKKTPSTMIVLVVLLALAVGPGAAQGPGPTEPMTNQAAVGTAFTYQGRLTDGGSPANGSYDFEFRLYDALSGGSQVGSTIVVPDQAVAEGLFTVRLDFGTVFQGDGRYLEIGVRPGSSSGAHTTLSPRQALTAAPYALYALRAAWSGLGGMPAGFADGVDDDTTYSAGTGLTLAGSQFSVNTTAIQARVTGTCASGNAIRVINADGTVACEAVGGGGWSLTGNSGTSPGTHFVGTTDNQALEVRVNRARALRLEPNATSPNLIGGYSGNSVTGGVMGATVGGGGASGTTNRVTDNYGTVGGGTSNRAGDNAGTTSDRSYATVGGGHKNAASGGYATVGGGYGNGAGGSYATVGGGHGNGASGGYATASGGYGNEASGGYATVGGGRDNEATGAGAFVGGGGYNGSAYAANQALGDASAIGGGYGNVISTTADYAAVGGGRDNEASGYAATVGGGGHNVAGSYYGTVGGGHRNRAIYIFPTVGGGSENWASGYGATVGGGVGNQASGSYATVGGGVSHVVSGYCATVPGGDDNTAGGNYSFAAGRRARANNEGCFVWADSYYGDVNCNNDNRTIFRSRGGFYIYTNAGLSSGMYLAGGGSAWNAVSNRELKENLAPVDAGQLLERLAQVEIGTWNYRAQDPAIRHIGPMAEDFNALVDGLGGEGMDHINSLDADGVALASVQELYRLYLEQKAENAALRQQVGDLEARLAALERMVSGAGGAQ